MWLTKTYSYPEIELCNFKIGLPFRICFAVSYFLVCAVQFWKYINQKLRGTYTCVWYVCYVQSIAWDNSQIVLHKPTCRTWALHNNPRIGCAILGLHRTKCAKHWLTTYLWIAWKCNSWVVPKEVYEMWINASHPETNQEMKSRVTPTKNVPALIANVVLENMDKALSTSIAGMAPGKKHFISSTWFLLGTLLLTFVERTAFCPAQNASQWCII